MTEQHKMAVYAFSLAVLIGMASVVTPEDRRIGPYLLIGVCILLSVSCLIASLDVIVLRWRYRKAFLEAVVAVGNGKTLFQIYEVMKATSHPITMEELIRLVPHLEEGGEISVRIGDTPPEQRIWGPNATMLIVNDAEHLFEY